MAMRTEEEIRIALKRLNEGAEGSVFELCVVHNSFHERNVITPDCLLADHLPWEKDDFSPMSTALKWVLNEEE